MTVSSTMRYPPATVNNRRNAKSRSVCPDQGPWSMRVNRSWETLSNASAMAEHVVRLVKYSNAMRYIHSGSGIDAHLPSERSMPFFMWTSSDAYLLLRVGKNPANRDGWKNTRKVRLEGVGVSNGAFPLTMLCRR